MLRRLLGALVALAAIAPGASAAPVCTDLLAGVNERCPDWTGAYNHPGGRGGDGEDIGRAVAVSPDGATVILAGQSRDDATLQDQATVAFDAATGSRRWAARYDSGDGQFDTASAVAASDDVVVASGRSVSSEGFDWATNAYDLATGAHLWTARVAGVKQVDDTSWAVAASPDGETFYVAGTIDDGASIPGDALVIAYAAETGEEAWRARYDGGGYDGGFRLEVAPDSSRVYLLGTTRRQNDDILLVAYEAQDEEHLGERVWAAALDSGSSDAAWAMDLSGDGSRIAVVATTGTGTSSDVLTAVVDAATGAKQWQATYAGTRNTTDTAGGVAIAAGRVVMTARAGEGVAGFDVTTRGYDLTTGAAVWTASENTGAQVPDASLAMTSLGDTVYLTGYFVVPRGEIQPIFNIEPGGMVTAAYDAATGTRRWIARHNQSGIGADVGVAIAAGGGRVYPAGTFIFSGIYVYPTTAAKAYAWDMGVVAYDA